MISRRKYDPLGIVLATDEGLLHVEPGRAPVIAVPGHGFTRVDFQDGLARRAPGDGVGCCGQALGARLAGDRSPCPSPPRERLIGSADGKLHRSTDKGATWETIDGVQNVIKLNRFSRPPASPLRGLGRRGHRRHVTPSLVAAAGTRDGGASWLRRADGLDPRIECGTRAPRPPLRLHAERHLPQ
jgi:hypothetical protein